MIKDGPKNKAQNSNQKKVESGSSTEGGANAN
jgi:hypothetical protein